MSDRGSRQKSDRVRRGRPRHRRARGSRQVIERELVCSHWLQVRALARGEGQVVMEAPPGLCAGDSVRLVVVLPNSIAVQVWATVAFVDREADGAMAYLASDLRFALPRWIPPDVCGE